MGFQGTGSEAPVFTVSKLSHAVSPRTTPEQLGREFESLRAHRVLPTILGILAPESARRKQKEKAGVQGRNPRPRSGRLALSAEILGVAFGE